MENGLNELTITFLFLSINFKPLNINEQTLKINIEYQTKMKRKYIIIEENNCMWRDVRGVANRSLS